MRTLTGLLSTVTLLLAAAAIPAQAQLARVLPSASHPLLGIWTLRIPQLACSETYHFRGDGTALVRSKEEVSESEFTVDEKPNAKGFYKLEDKIVKDNGKRDCSGEITPVGDHATSYLRFHASGARFLLCNDETTNACVGWFERAPAQGI